MSISLYTPPDPDLDHEERDIDRDEAAWDARWQRLSADDRRAQRERMRQNYGEGHGE